MRDPPRLPAGGAGGIVAGVPPLLLLAEVCALGAEVACAACGYDVPPDLPVGGGGDTSAIHTDWARSDQLSMVFLV